MRVLIFAMGLTGFLLMGLTSKPLDIAEQLGKVASWSLAYGWREEAVFGHSLEKSVAIRYGHHNGCDSFTIDLGYAQYAATSAWDAGCSPPLPGAPYRDETDKRKTMIYTIIYHGKVWKEPKESEMSHFLLVRKFL